MADGFNAARALRVAELMNDYRTLHLHISEHTMGVPLGDTTQEGYRVLAQSQAAAQRLLMANFVQTPVYSHGGDLEMEKAQLRQVILDASARRFHAHKLYLRVAAGKRWVIHREGPSSKPQEEAARMREVDTMLRTELSNITDQFIYSDLRDADLRAGHWVDEDPPLAAILLWINSQP